MSKEKEQLFDGKITWGILLTAIAFIGSYYLMYTKVDSLQENNKDIKVELRDIKNKQDTATNRLTVLETVQKHMQITLDRLDRRSANRSNTGAEP